MGAEVFIDEGAGADPKEVFAKLVSEAAYESGSGGYTGTIAEKPGFVIVRSSPLPPAAAARLANAIISDYEGKKYPRHAHLQDKWGDAGAIAVTRQGGKLRTRTVSVSLDSSTGNRWEDEELLGKAALAKIGTLAPNEVVSDTKVEDFKTRTKITAAKTEGKTVRRYELAVRSNGNIQRAYHGLPRGPFDTQPLAMAAAKAWLKEKAQPGNIEVVVIGCVLREDGDVLGSVSMQAQSVSAKVTVTIEQLPQNPATDGWLFFGWASS